MDRSTKAKAAAKAAQEILENPKAKDVLKLQAAKLIFEYESEQARLAEQRAQRRHEQRKERQEIAILKTLNASLKKRLAALEAAVCEEEPEPDPAAEYWKQFREQTSAPPAGAHQEAAEHKQQKTEFLPAAGKNPAKAVSSEPVPAPTPLTAPVGLDPRLEFKSQTLRQIADQTGNTSIKSLLGDKPSFTPAPAPRTAAELGERQRQERAARETAQPIDPLDRAIAELPELPDLGDGGPLISDQEYLLALREGNAALDRVLAQPRLRPVVSQPVSDTDV